jgi:multiple sugar transport system ATP-binding protein
MPTRRSREDEMAGVELDRVTKTYKNGQEAVRELSLEIQDGEFMVLVGPSGCGKSTTLRMVAGLESISAGSIRIGERIVNDVEPQDRDVAMVFQSYALYPHMTVFDNLAFGLRRKRLTKADVARRVTDTARALGLDELLKRRPAELSGGQRQRVALGRAIVRDPQIFLMDEPLSNLDALLRVETRFEILKLHQRLGATFIYVTHDQVEAMTMGDRIAVMRDGLLQQVDAPGPLYERPANRFVAGFIGSPRMNFLDMELSEVDGELRLLGNGVALSLTPAQLGASKVGRGARLVVGLRPEHLLDQRYAPTGTATVTGRVEVVETLGSELHVHLRVREQPMVARMDPRSADLRPGQEIQLAVNHQRLQLFDPDTGQAIAPAEDAPRSLTANTAS